MERGKHLKHNQEKLDATSDINSEWVKALEKCRDHVKIRLRKRTVFGAHTEERLGGDPIDYYVSFAYDAILDGHWEWKEGRTLSQQMIRIADNRIGKEVEKYHTEPDNNFSMTGDEIDMMFYSTDPLPGEPSFLEEISFNKQISIIEGSVQGDENLEMFWECVKDGMKRVDIADFMEKTPKQVDKMREKLVNKIKNSPYFQL